MTGLLLDTHVLLWVLLSPDRIPASTLDAIRAPDNALYVSAAGAWEIATKHRLGKLDGAGAVVDGYQEHLTTLGAQELAISGPHALMAGGMNWAHRDPFDRILVAQSLLESLPVVTGDRVLSDFPGIRTIW